MNPDGPRDLGQGVPPTRALWAYVCLACGYTELYTDQPHRLRETRPVRPPPAPVLPPAPGTPEAAEQAELDALATLPMLTPPHPAPPPPRRRGFHR